MSDTAQGPGWWLASDGRWYPPESRTTPPPPPPPVALAPQPTPSALPNPYEAGNQPAPYQASPYKPCKACGSRALVSAITCTRCGTPFSTPHSKGAAILLAVFLSFWTWVYTYKRDAAKFWIGLVLGVLGAFTALFIVGFLLVFGVWIWAIIDTAAKSDTWYQQYPNSV
jgi:hypothetical protein